MSSNIKLIIAYDGGLFLGWQKTKEGASIEGELQNVLEQILQEPIHLQATSRTDAGVHAQGQVVNFLSQKSSINLQKLLKSLNALLPDGIAVLHAEEMPPSFHPTLDCIEKEYHYWICNTPTQLPIHRFYSWHYSYPLNLKEMSDASSFFIGRHLFQAFCNNVKETKYISYEREVSSLIIHEHTERRFQFIIRGPHFLYKMIRNIIGTLVYVGVGKIKGDSIPKILSSGSRLQAGVTAPAHGLTLYQIRFK